MNFIITLVGLFVVTIMIYLWFSNKSRLLRAEEKNSILAKISEYELEIKHKDSYILDLKNNSDKYINELKQDNQRLLEDKIELTKNLQSLSSKEKYDEKIIEDLKNIQNNLLVQFKNISNEVVNKQKDEFNSKQSEGLKVILEPLKKDIVEFKEKIEKANVQSASEQGRLNEQLKNLQLMNSTLSKEAQDLTKALKNQSKVRGNWGETILEEILQINGLVKNQHYELQPQMSDNTYPDCVLNLPDNRQVVIDSKVSLVDYLNYMNEEEDNQAKKTYLNNHIKSIKNHIKELSSKEYQKKLSGSSLDYVFMFIPNEQAYLDALLMDNSIYLEATKSNIAIVTPSSIIPVVMMIDNIWKLYTRHKNIDEIIRLAGALYDKVFNYSHNMERLGKALKNANDIHGTALKQLSEGSGNILVTSQKIKKYGVSTKKNLDEISFFREIEDNDEDNREQKSLDS